MGLAASATKLKSAQVQIGKARAATRNAITQAEQAALAGSLDEAAVHANVAAQWGRDLLGYLDEAVTALAEV